MARNTLAGGAVALAVLLAYLNSLAGSFQFDDYNVIVDAVHAHSWQAWFAQLGHGLRPLLKASYMLNWTLDASPAGFHVVNLLLHLANTGLVAALALAFGRRCAPAEDWRGVALTAALLFGLHPVHTEAVTYISGRSTELMTCFYLAALLAWERGRHHGVRGWILPLLLFGAAVATKEGALLFPLALLVWQWAGGTPPRAALARQWPFWAAGLAAATVLLLIPGYRALLADALRQADGDALLAHWHAATALLGKWWWPVDLDIDPDWPRELAWRDLALPLGVWLPLTFAAWRLRARRPWWTLAIAWAGLHLLLLNSFLPRADVANERLLYWADWGLFLALAAELSRLSRRTFATALTALLALALGTATVMRNEVYRDEVGLWQDTVRKSPDKARCWNNLGLALAAAGRGAEAAAAYRRALALDPDHVKAFNNLERLEEDEAPR